MSFLERSLPYDVCRREAIEVAKQESLHEIAESGRRDRMRYLAGP